MLHTEILRLPPFLQARLSGTWDLSDLEKVLQAETEALAADFDLEAFDLLHCYMDFFASDGNANPVIAQVRLPLYQALKRGYRRDPSDFSMLIALAILDRDMGDTAQARVRLEKVVRSEYSIRTRALALLQEIAP